MRLTLKKGGMWGSARARREALTFYLFLGPWLLGFLLFTVGPIIASLTLSFTRWDMMGTPAFIGLRNFREALLEDPLVRKSLANTLWWAVVTVPLFIFIPFFLALLLNQKVRGIAFYRTVYYLPAVVPALAAIALWLWLLHPQFGLINTVLRFAGLQPINWLGDPQWSKPALVLMSLWGTGGGVIIWLAGLQGIPEELYDAAAVDGAGRWQKFRHVTVPLMTPTFFFMLIMGVIGSFQVFTQAYVMTQGGPLDSTLFYMLYLFQQAFHNFRMGYAAALAWMLFLLILVLTIVNLMLGRYWVFYEGERR